MYLDLSIKNVLKSIMLYSAWTSVKQTYQFIYTQVFDTSMCQCLFKQWIAHCKYIHIKKGSVWRRLMDFFHDGLWLYCMNRKWELQVILSTFFLCPPAMVWNHFSTMSSTPSWLLLQAGEVGATASKVPRNLSPAEVKSRVLPQESNNKQPYILY